MQRSVRQLCRFSSWVPDNVHVEQRRNLSTPPPSLSLHSMNTNVPKLLVAQVLPNTAHVSSRLSPHPSLDLLFQALALLARAHTISLAGAAGWFLGIEHPTQSIIHTALPLIPVAARHHKREQESRAMSKEAPGGRGQGASAGPRPTHVAASPRGQAASTLGLNPRNRWNDSPAAGLRMWRLQAAVCRDPVQGAVMCVGRDGETSRRVIAREHEDRKDHDFPWCCTLDSTFAWSRDRDTAEPPVQGKRNALAMLNHPTQPPWAQDPTAFLCPSFLVYPLNVTLPYMQCYSLLTMIPIKRVNTSLWDRYHKLFASPNTFDMEAVWKEAKPDELMDSKLRCVFEMPNENDKLNDIEPSKALPLNASKQDGRMPKPHRVSLNDTETRKLMEECKRIEGEMMKLSEENGHLKDEGLRLRKVAHSDKPLSISTASFRDNVTSPLPLFLIVTAAIFIGFILGKFIL
ncbi:Vesicle-associated membrane protein-associated protein A [Galemys pyrenaicus]|uniref:Vesicle-associated membrane protein-associated protein A n=1 Tax=Galemys pyrenaicus TaxID=202257 RepID=A0A8J6DEQ7_GALPY|nr:Vesicle-associated membrane protein-associated protein A [Galemys pyrenaicus]